MGAPRLERRRFTRRVTRSRSRRNASTIGRRSASLWARASLPKEVVGLQIRDELIGEVHSHAVNARLYGTLHHLFRGDTPSARDEAFSMKAMNQLWRYRVSSRT